jgi:hypothetical protein
VSAAWDIYLSDLNGTLKARAPQQFTLELAQQRNGPRTLQLDLNHLDPAAALITPGETLVQAWRTDPDGVRSIKHHGIAWSVDTNYSTGDLTILVADPWARLSARFTSADFTSVDQGTIIKTLVDSCNSTDDTGIETSASYIEATTTRDRTYSDGRTVVSEAILSLTQVLDGIDVELVPIAYTSGKFARLYVYDRQGSTTPQAVLGIGPGTVANLASLSRSRSMEAVATLVNAYGEGGIVSSKTDATQLAALGLYVRDDTYSEVLHVATLGEHAQETLDVHKTPSETVTAAPGQNAPMLWDDFDIGDNVSVEAAFIDQDNERHAFTTTARVEAATVEYGSDRAERLSSITLEGAA